jgi:2,4-dienoyl-CoA reductase (NADPH2)
MKTNPKFPNSFLPLEVHGVTLKNRFIMGSMHTGLEEDKNFDQLTTYFEQRAKGGVGTIITGGFSPNFRGRLTPFAAQFSHFWHKNKHQELTERIQQHGSKIILQLLHAGRYAHHPFLVSSSSLKAPISKFTPHVMFSWEIKKTIKDFINSSSLAQKAGYDGVEIMGSEGYLLNQFLSPVTNKRNDQWGESSCDRRRLCIEIVKGIRQKVGSKFLIIFRISTAEFIKDGQTKAEVLALAKELEDAGVSILNTGIGWHESRIPTIVTSVPRKNFLDYTAMLKEVVSIPCVAVNRFNNAEDVEFAISSGKADLVSLARPFLADPNFVNKIQANKTELINTCIACNQACLDHIFVNKIASCLVNPKACQEINYLDKKAARSKKILVIGAGPAGLSFSIEAASKGHKVVLIEKNDRIGGQFLLAQKIPGKEEFKETLRYYQNQILINENIELKLNCNLTDFTQTDLNEFEKIVISAGVIPRKISLEGSALDYVYSYDRALKSPPAKLGRKVAVLGAGGIGFDMCTYLLKELKSFDDFWGVDKEFKNPGALKDPLVLTPQREVFLFQRSSEKFGKTLGKTTGWIHRQSLKKLAVNLIPNAQYQKIEDHKIYYSIDGVEHSLVIDSVILCVGQESNHLAHDFLKANIEDLSKIEIIGGAKSANAIDAKRAIAEGLELAFKF